MKKILLIFFGVIFIIGLVQFVLNPSEFLSSNTTNTTNTTNTVAENVSNKNTTNETNTTELSKSNTVVTNDSKKQEDVYSIREKNVKTKIAELYGENADIIGLMQERTEVENKIYYDGILGRTGYKDKDFTAIINKDDNSLISLSVDGEIVY